ncbi:hypothetical protein VTJ04DRAFT_2905 [Mycothermus thermophilus]|uniref:uncharacterized protein n=1 Tax=Humicola insolens TaxID=85995 RepID=UPI0037424457
MTWALSSATVVGGGDGRSPSPASSTQRSDPALVAYRTSTQTETRAVKAAGFRVGACNNNNNNNDDDDNP